jgi:CDP-6-deoxy-D-xylo-4-hexulose-3-dehydrase
MGAVPVFVDVDIPSYNVSITRLKQAISKKTRAVYLAHTMGNPFNCEQVRKICKQHDLLLIEDNCDSLGSVYGGLPTGGWGDVSTLSFYPAHHISTGEGGMVCTNNPTTAKIVRSLRDWGRDCVCKPGRDGTCGKRFQQQFGGLPFGYDHKYVYTRVGYNLKATEIQAAIGLAQLKRLEFFTKQRRANWEQLRQELHNMEDVLILPEPEPHSAPSWFAFMITLRAEDEGVHMIGHLEANGVQTRRLFAGNMTLQPFLEGIEYRVCGDLRNTNKIMRDTFAVGVWPGLGEDDISTIAQRIKAFYGR